MAKNTTGNYPHYADNGNKQYLEAIRKGYIRMIKPKTVIIGKFGIVEGCGFENMLHWRVDGWRKDRKVMFDQTPKPYDNSGKWVKRQFEDMFRGW